MINAFHKVDEFGNSGLSFDIAKGAPTEALSIIKTYAPSGKPNIPAIIEHGTQISVWNRNHGKGFTAKVLYLFLVSLNNYFNVVRPMSAEHMEDIAADMANMWEYKFEDFIAFFEGVKRERWGKIRDRLDPSVIWDQWDGYLFDRDQYFTQRANAHKYSDPYLPNPDDRIFKQVATLAGKFSQTKNALNDKRKLDS